MCGRRCILAVGHVRGITKVGITCDGIRAGFEFSQSPAEVRELCVRLQEELCSNVNPSRLAARMNRGVFTFIKMKPDGTGTFYKENVNGELYQITL